MNELLKQIAEAIEYGEEGETAEITQPEELSIIRASFMFILVGVGFICLGSHVGNPENFAFISKFVIIGDAKYTHLNEMIGYIFGCLFLGIGIFLWFAKLLEHQQFVRTRLAHAKGGIKMLSGLLPLCPSCKRSGTIS